MTDGHWSEDFPFPGAKELGERYAKKFNEYSLRVGVEYALVQMPSTAIEKAGTLDSEKGKQVFLTHEFKGTVMGDVKYGADGIAFYVNTGNQWWDGRQRLVYPFVKGGWKVTLAPHGINANFESSRLNFKRSRLAVQPGGGGTTPPHPARFILGPQSF